MKIESVPAFFLFGIASVAFASLAPVAPASAQHVQQACLCTPDAQIHEFEPTCPLDLQSLVTQFGKCTRVGWNCTQPLVQQCSAQVTAGAGSVTARADCGTLGGDSILCDEGGFYAVAVDCSPCNS